MGELVEVRRTEHIPSWKLEEVSTLKKLLSEYPVVALAGVFGIPARQMQQIRRELRGTALLKMSRNTLISRALDELGGEYPKLKEYLEEQTMLVFTRLNPFKLYRVLEASKTPAPIKGGMTAPRDIVVSEGPTSFAPGPVVGELQRIGIPAAIEGGKVVIRESKTVARAGEVVSDELATMLTKLEIYPMEIGLTLRAALEDGVVFTSSELAIDVEQYVSQLAWGASAAFNLAVNIAHPTAETVPVLLSMAASNALKLAAEAELFVPEVMELLLSRGYGSALSLASVVASKSPEALDEGTLRLVSSSAAQAAAQPEEAAEEQPAEEEKAEEEEEEAEESGIEGLGALFG
ncbi:50S ribosomal protein L10 [Methermicoccus shengliensis]|uniref:Large ribosomal subunit protein uL10 n=1 Tax=Methermicoccus shengliensis TaxID=660064 RepID=A0A832VZL7_9EURY|nr:50S ribosomal protein L10 [Methermicoccus shengliensis]HIH69470.1 50S ribosomal protein L10 [Methermicoccus shengliensis]